MECCGKVEESLGGFSWREMDMKKSLGVLSMRVFLRSGYGLRFVLVLGMQYRDKDMYGKIGTS